MRQNELKRLFHFNWRLSNSSRTPCPGGASVAANASSTVGSSAAARSRSSMNFLRSSGLSRPTVTQHKTAQYNGVSHRQLLAYRYQIPKTHSLPTRTVHQGGGAVAHQHLRYATSRGSFVVVATACSATVSCKIRSPHKCSTRRSREHSLYILSSTSHKRDVNLKLCLVYVHTAWRKHFPRSLQTIRPLVRAPLA